jgi:hypothetical protein
MRRWTIALVLALSVGTGAQAGAAETGAAESDAAAPVEAAAAATKDATAEQGAGESEADELSRRATDPTSSPPNIGLINDFTLDYRDRADGTPKDGTGYQIRLQPVVPFSAWGTSHILRMTVPYQVSGPDPEGLGDVTIFDLLVLPQKWGRLGVGLVGSFAAATSDVAAHAAVGPAIGFVAPASKKLNLGLFNQNVFGDDTAISQLQPIVAYQLGSGWSLTVGDLQWVYDWERGEFVSMPLGLQLGKVLPVAGQPMRFAVNPQYDLKDLAGNSRFKLVLIVTLLLPEGR